MHCYSNVISHEHYGYKISNRKISLEIKKILIIILKLLFYLL